VKRGWQRFEAWRTRHPRAYRLAQWGLGALLTGLLGWLTVRGLQWSQVASAFGRFSLAWGGVALGIYLLGNFVRAVRWRVLFVGGGVRTWRLFLIQNAGIGLNNVMPIRAFSEVTQFALLRWRDRVDTGQALATLGAERVLDMMASTLLLALGLLTLPQMGGFRGFGPQFGFAILVTLGWLAFVQGLAWAGVAHPRLGRVRWLREMGSALLHLERRHSTRLGVSFLLTLGYWLLLGGSAWALGEGVGLGLSLGASVLVVVVTTFVATSTPSVAGAVGTFEFAAVYMVGFFGVEQADALGFAVLLHAVLFLPPVVIGLPFLLREWARWAPAGLEAPEGELLSSRAGGGG